MRSLRLVAALARTALLRRGGFAIGVVLVLAFAAAAQQPAVGRQKVPRLTTDDVARPAPPPESTEAAAKSTGETGKPGAPVAAGAQAKSADAKPSPEEASWRERVSKARSHAKELERSAEEAELRITALRNDLGKSGESAKYRNNTAAEMDQAGAQLKEIRAQAKAAADDLAQLVDYGKQKGFTEAEGPKPTTESGNANEEYFRSRLVKVKEDIESAQRRVELYNNRVRDLNQQLATNASGKDKNGHKTGGDSFYSGQVQQERDDAQQKLDEARSALTKAQNDLEELQQEARRAGVPPGLFR